MAAPNRVSPLNMLVALIALLGGGGLLFWFVIRPLLVTP